MKYRNREIFHFRFIMNIHVLVCSEYDFTTLQNTHLLISVCYSYYVYSISRTNVRNFCKILYSVRSSHDN